MHTQHAHAHLTLSRSHRALLPRAESKIDATGRSIQPVGQNRRPARPPPSKPAACSGPRRQNRQNQTPRPPPSPVLTGGQNRSKRAPARGPTTTPCYLLTSNRLAARTRTHTHPARCIIGTNPSISHLPHPVPVHSTKHRTMFHRVTCETSREPRASLERAAGRGEGGETTPDILGRRPPYSVVSPGPARVSARAPDLAHPSHSLRRQSRASPAYLRERVTTLT